MWRKRKWPAVVAVLVTGASFALWWGIAANSDVILHDTLSDAIRFDLVSVDVEPDGTTLSGSFVLTYEPKKLGILNSMSCPTQITIGVLPWDEASDLEWLVDNSPVKVEHDGPLAKWRDNVTMTLDAGMSIAGKCSLPRSIDATSIGEPRPNQAVSAKCMVFVGFVIKESLYEVCRHNLYSSLGAETVYPFSEPRLFLLELRSKPFYVSKVGLDLRHEGNRVPGY